MLNTSNDILESIIHFRLAERGIIAIFFIFISVLLIYSHRKDLSETQAAAEGGGMKIAFSATKPFFGLLALLGYAYVSLSNPITIDRNEDDDRVVRAALFDESGLSRLFTNLAIKKDGIAAGQVAKAQEILFVAVRIQSLEGERRAEIDDLIRNPESTIQEIGVLLNEQ